MKISNPAAPMLALLVVGWVAPLAAQTCGVLPNPISRSSVESTDPLVFPDVRPVPLPDPGTALSLSLDPLPDPLIADQAIALGGSYAGPPGTAVTVDGRAARMDSGRWWLPYVGLEPGLNTVRIVAATHSGERIEETLSINSDPALTPLPRLEVERAEAFLPVALSLRLHLPTDAAVSEVRADLDGDGQFDYVGPPMPTLDKTLLRPGPFVARVELHQAGAPPAHLSLAGVVPRVGLTRVTLCQLLERLRDHLKAGDIEAALALLHPELHDVYRPLWQDLGASLPALADALGEVADGSLGFSEAELIVLREEGGLRVGYPVQFSRDREGLWKISGL